MTTIMMILAICATIVGLILLGTIMKDVLAELKELWLEILERYFPKYYYYDYDEEER